MIIYKYFILLIFSAYILAIDVVIPCHEKDLDLLEYVIDGARKNVIGLGEVFVISEKKLTNNAIWIDEKKFPFTKESIAFEIFQDKTKAIEYILYKNNRLSWIYQQLLKLYVPFIQNFLSNNVLMLDADTIFINQINFVNEDGVALYNTRDLCHRSYLDHYYRLFPGAQQALKGRSGVVHYMLYQKDLLFNLHNECEKNYGIVFWKAFCRQIDKNLIYNNFASQILLCSEWEIYFNYVFVKFPNRVKERRLATADIGDSFCKIPEHIDYFKNKGFASISFHHWFQQEHKNKSFLNQPEYTNTR